MALFALTGPWTRWISEPSRWYSQADACAADSLLLDFYVGIWSCVPDSQGIGGPCVA